MNIRPFLHVFLLAFAIPVTGWDAGKPDATSPTPLLAALSATPVASGRDSRPDVESPSNLLANPGFEDGRTGWDFSCWRSAGSVSSDNAVKRDGEASVRIENPSVDDSFLKQAVAVKPRTRYQLSGYIKTKDVESDSGANLAVQGGFEKTQSLTGDNNWTKVSFVFDSGARESVKVGPRLGHHGKLATGVAWFDDLSLVELGPTPAPTPNPNRSRPNLRDLRSGRSADAGGDTMEAQPKLLKISATVDGSGRMIFTRQSLRYEHKHWDLPTDVTVDGEPWTNLSQTPPAWREIAGHLDLAKAWIVKREGRDVIAMEPTPDGFALYLCDSPNGAAKYEVTIAIPRRR
jgi:hypothetical protein